MFKDRRLTIFAAITLLMFLGTLVRGTVSYFSDIESSTGNSPSAWISRQWTQTAKADFDAGVLTGINTSLSSGDAVLKPGDSSTTDYFFLLWDNSSSIPTGWTNASISGQAFFQRFPRGAATYGGTGGTATHSHTRTLASLGTPSGITSILSGAANRSSGTHNNHTMAAGSTATASSLPGYRNLRVIQYTGVPAVIPAGAIAIFDGALPAGWTQYSAQNGYFVRGEAAAQTGVTGGSNTHNHTVSGTLAASNQYQVAATTAPTTAVAAIGHTHTISGTTPDGDTRPPFISVVLAKVDSDTTVPYGMIAMFSAAPAGAWSVLSGTGGPFESRFIVGDSSYGATGGAATHIHSNLTVTSTNSTTTGAASTTSPNASAAANGHNHSVTLSFADGSSLPPYRDVIFAKAIYPASGTLTSQVLDTTATPSRWDALFWDETLPASTDITFEVRASDTSFLKTDVTPAWTAAGGTSPVLSGLAAGRYKQWRATLTTGSTANTPVLREVRVYYYGASTQWTQTAKADFDAGILTGVNTSLSSGDAILEPGDSSTTAFFFLLWDNSSSIPSGWTDVSISGQAFYQRFPRGAATYSGTGGTATHSHTRTLASLGTPSGITSILSGAANRSSGTHNNHTMAAGSTATASSLPGYRNLRVIRYTGVPAVIPAGAIAIFDGALPAGWTQYSAQDGYFVRGEAAAQTGVTGGSNTHNHTVSGTLAASNQYQVAATTAPTTAVAAIGHTHTISGTTPDGDTRPPFISVVLAKADSDTTIPYGMIAMFSATPAGAWSVLSGTGGPFESRFIVGDTSYGATGGAATHIHSNLTVTSTNSTTTAAASTTSPNASAAANGHNHSVTLSFADGSSLPPYRDVIFAKAIYPASGTLASQVLDTTIAGTTWESLFWDETLPASTDITFEVRASDTSFLKTAVTPAWTAAGGTSPVSSGLPSGRYKQWRATLTSGSTAITPVLAEVRVYYDGP